MDSSRRRPPCFIEDDGDDVEAGYSGNNHHPLFNKSSSGYSRNRSSLRNLSMSGFSSPRSSRLYEARFEEPHHQPHFLEACFLCQKSLGGNRDIFMYRGDTPFCSEECRQEQMDIDEAKEKKWNLSSSMKALRKKDQKKNSTSPSKTQDYSLRTGTVAAA